MDLSASMMVDTRKKTSSLLSSRRPKMWIPDHRVRSCFKCRTPFSMFRRRHHCRFCGRIFCGQCTSFTARHAQFTGLETLPQRACEECAIESKVEEQNGAMIVALHNMPIPMSELWKIALVSKKWKSIWKSFTRIRSLQYQPPYYTFKRLEKMFLITHEAEIFFHSRWHMVFVHAVGRHPKYSRKESACDTLMCVRDCKRHLDDRCILQIVVHHPNVYVNFTSGMDWMTPWWVRSGRTAPTITCLVECNIQKKDDLYHKVYESLNPQQVLVWERVKTLYRAFRKLAYSRTMEEKYNIVFGLFHKGQRYPYPWTTHFIVAIDTENMRVLNSNTSPVVVPLVFSNGEKRVVLLKPEDVRNDRLAQCVGMWISRMSNVPVKTYNVTAISDDCGMIEMAPDAHTLYDITHSKNTSLLNFVLSKNGSLPINTVRSKLIESVAVSCVMTYILGVGDRHQENILCTNDGVIFHIDYGYILGSDPHGAPCEIRITRDILDAIGGMDSPGFKEFENKCRDIYYNVRRCSPLWYSLLQHLGPNKVSKWVSERLVPGEWDSEASTQIVDVVKRNSSGSWIQSALDITHMVKNVFRNSIKSVQPPTI